MKTKWLIQLPDYVLKKILTFLLLFIILHSSAQKKEYSLSSYDIFIRDSLEKQLKTSVEEDRAPILSLLTHYYRYTDTALAYKYFFESLSLSEKYGLYQNCYNSFTSLVNEHDSIINTNSLQELIYACEQRKLHRSAILGNVFKAVLHIRKNEYDKAEAILYEMMHESEKTNFQFGIATVYHRLGQNCLFKSEYVKALKFLLKAIQINTNEGYTEAQALNHYFLGLIEFKLGNFDNATENILKSLAYWENVGNKANMWNCNEVFGNICIKCQDFEKALHYHRIALNIREQTINYRISKGGNNLTENYLGIAYSYNNIAETYLNMGIADSALFYAIRSLEIKLSENSVASAMDVANSHLILGKVYHTLRKYDSAIIILNRAAESYKKIGNKSGQSEALLGLGKAYVSTNLPDKAIIAYETGLSLAKEANAKSNILEGYQLLNEYYTKERNFEKALLHFNSYNNYKDSIFNIERINKIEELQIKYETEKQQQELEFHKVLVQKKNRQLKLSVIASLVILFLSGLVIFLIHKTRRQKEILLKQQAEALKKDIELNLFNSQTYNFLSNHLVFHSGF